MYATEVRQLIVDFAESVVRNGLYSQFAMPMEVLKDQLLKTSDLLPAQSQRITEAIEAKARGAHRQAPPAIQKYLIPVYKQCGAEGG